MIGPYSKNHGIGTEVEDLRALLDDMHAPNVFWLSAGAVIAIEAARTLRAITRLALYEPPLEFDSISQTAADGVRNVHYKEQEFHGRNIGFQAERRDAACLLREQLTRE